MCTQEKLNSPFVTRYIACERKKKTPIELQRRDTQRKDRVKMMVTKETPVACLQGPPQARQTWENQPSHQGVQSAPKIMGTSRENYGDQQERPQETGHNKYPWFIMVVLTLP